MSEPPWRAACALISRDPSPTSVGRYLTGTRRTLVTVVGRAIPAGATSTIILRGPPLLIVFEISVEFRSRFRLRASRSRSRLHIAPAEPALPLGQARRLHPQPTSHWLFLSRSWTTIALG